MYVKNSQYPKSQCATQRDILINSQGTASDGSNVTFLSENLQGKPDSRVPDQYPQHTSSHMALTAISVNNFNKQFGNMTARDIKFEYNFGNTNLR